MWISANAAGTDVNLGNAIASSTGVSNEITIQSGAQLAGSSSVEPLQVSVGQNITLVLSVTNNGTAGASAVTPGLPGVSGTGSVSVVSSPAVTAIAGGASAHFTWVYTAATAGQVSFTAGASGTDANSTAVVTTGAVPSAAVVIQAPAALVSGITASPATVGMGDTITVVMTVNNTGTAGAVNVTADPANLTVGGSVAGFAALITTPSPAVITIAGGASASFTWTYSCEAEGNLTFAGRATGVDANSTAAANSVVTTSNAVNVRPNYPVLSSRVEVAPRVVNQNQRYTVIMTVSNVGIVDASPTTPSAIVPVLGSTLQGTVAPEYANIPAGGVQRFTYVFLSSATTGTAAIAANAASYGQTSSNIASGENTIQVVSDASLVHDMVVSPEPVSVGQRITVVMYVTNNGGSAAEGVVPEAVIKLGTGNYTYVSGPVPASQTIASGASGRFTWTYDAVGAGSLAVNSAARGYSEYSKVTVVSVPEDSNYIMIQSPALLTGAVYMPATINIGQWFTVRMVVTNTGSAGANAVTPPLSLTLAGAGGAVKIAGPVPVNAAIAGGAVQVYEWTYSGAGAGAITLSGAAAGTDGNSGAVVTTGPVTSNILTVQVPAALSMSISASPAIVGTGYAITVVGVVTNNGQARADNVRVIELDDAVVSGGNAAMTTGAIPGPAVTLNGGASASFTWIYTANTTGTINFTGRAAGVDANTVLGVTSTAAVSGNVEIRDTAFLTADVRIEPAVVSVGQQITITMNITNTGVGNAAAVTGQNIIKGGTGNFAYVSGPAPLTQGVAGGANAEAVWVYSATAAGTLWVSGNAAGTDVNLGNAIASSTGVSNEITIQQPSALAVSLYASPLQVSTGSLVTVVMSVTNTGAATAYGVMGVTPTVSAGAGALTLVTSPESVVIAGGASALLTWTYNSSITGNVVVTSSAFGYDLNTGIYKVSGQTASQNILIQSPSQLSSAISISPDIAGVTYMITVIMTVTNNGQAEAVNVAPAEFRLIENIAGRVSVSAAQTPATANIQGNSSAAFTWVYQAVNQGTIMFTARASGFDGNSGFAVNSAEAQSRNLPIVPNNPVMYSYMAVYPNTVNTNQRYTLVLTVSNQGIVNAPDVTPPSLLPVLGSTQQGDVTPLTADIAPGDFVRFTWIYLSNAVTTGNAAIDGLATSGAWTSTTISDGTTNRLTVVGLPSLTNEIILMPAVVSAGQNVTMIMSVTNTGFSAAESVKPGALVKLGTSNYSIESGPVPVTYTIGAGASAYYRWVLKALTAGTLGINSYSEGYAQYSKITITAEVDDSNEVTVQTPAALAASISVPAYRNIGQWITVRMTVTNNGQAAANNIALPTVLTVEGTGGAVRINGPLGLPANIAGGASAVFTWTYSAAGSGSVVFKATASAVDANSLMTVNSNQAASNVLNIQTPASLSASVSAVPATAGTGYPITVVVNVSNTGMASAANVSVIEVDDAQVSLGNANLVSGVIPSAPVTINGGGSSAFTWIFEADTTGTINFTARAAGIDANTLLGVTSTAAVSNSVSIVDAAYLSAAVSASPAFASAGQAVTIIVTVTNTGMGDASGVSPLINSIAGTGSLAYSLGPVPAVPQAIAGGGTNAAAFTYIYNAAAAGVVNVNASASGTDTVLGNSISSVLAVSNSVTIETVPLFAVSLGAYPVVVNTAQTITLVMSVTNNGMADALNVAPSVPVMTGLQASLLDSPMPQSIAGGAEAFFTWTYTAASTGTVVFAAGVQGADENSLAVISSAVVQSNSVAIQSPAMLISSIAAYPPAVGINATITVVMSVTNTGGSTASGITPQGFVIDYLPSYIYVSGPVPAAFDLAGGTSAYFTWAYQPTALGSAVFRASAAGTDINTLAAVNSAEAQSNAVDVFPNTPQLASWIKVSPNTVNTNQIYTVIMGVSNVGIVSAPDTVPDPIAGAVGTLQNAGPVPATANIPAGGYQEYTWIYSAPAAAVNSVITGLARSQGLYISQNRTSPGANSISVAAVSSLTASITVSPSQVSAGQKITVVMRVINAASTSDAKSTMPAPLVKLGTGTAVYESGPLPVSYTVASGTEVYYTWVYATSGAGSIGFNSYVTAYAQYSNVTLTSAPVNSNYTLIQQPAFLTAALYAPQYVNAGEEFTVRMVVTNTGGAAASNVAASDALGLAGTGGAVEITGPLPASAAIAAGASVVYEWTFSATGTGIIVLQGAASGTDFNSTAPISSGAVSSPQINIQTPVSLSLNISTLPSVTGTGYPLTVIAVVTNNGQAGASAVRVPDLDDEEVTAGTDAVYVSGPVPASRSSLAGGASAVFTWIYTASTTGTLRFTATAEGTDNNSGTLRFSNTAAGNNVEIRNSAFLTSAVSLFPAVASIGQQVTAIMTVTNVGQGDVQWVEAVNFTQAGTAAFANFSGPVPQYQTILGGGSNEGYITWIFTATTAGVKSVSVSARGFDMNLGNTINSAYSGSAVITVQSAANLTASLSALPVKVSSGQTVTAVMTVNNTGAAGAVDVTSIEPTKESGTGSLALLTSPLPVYIAGGSSAAFTWTYQATAAGNVILTSSAYGEDENSGFIKTSAKATAPAVLIQSPAALAASVIASPAIAGVGDTITVIMAVNNAGQATAVDVVPDPAGLSVTGSSASLTIALLSGPQPVSATVAGGATAYFTWTYSAAQTGNLVFSGAALGDDENSLLSADSGIASSNTVLVQPNTPVLLSHINAFPRVLSVNQRYTVVMTVSNTGIVSAPLVAPDTLYTEIPSGVLVNPAPANANIASGGVYRFTWIYQTLSTTGTGVITGLARSGIYASDDISSGNVNTITVYSAPILSQVINMSPAVVSVGQNFTIVMSASNNGESAAEGMKPNAFIKLGTGTYQIVSGPEPVSATALTGETVNYTWIYKAMSAGNLGVNGNVTAYNYYSKATVTSAAANSNLINVVSPAALTASLHAPALLNLNDVFEVIMTVTNTGSATAQNVLPSFLSINGLGGAILAGPMPAAQNIPGGAARVFTFTYQAAGTGTLDFRGSAEGTDENSQQAVTSNEAVSNNVSINRPAALEINLSMIQPSTVGTGQYITLILSVTNTGDTVALNTNPVAMLTEGTAAVNYISGPVPASAGTLNGGASARFTWIYQSVSSGYMTFSASASAVDALSAAAVPVSPVESAAYLTVEDAASLNISSFVIQPATASIGQNITVIVTVNNDGTGDASSITPSLIAKTGTANLSYILGPNPVSAASLLSGTNTTFTWRYTAASAGTAYFTISASGWEDTRSVAISAAQSQSNVLTVQQPSALTAGSFAVPAQASVGQVITVVVSVTNSGGAEAEYAYGVTTVATGAGSAVYDGNLWPVPANIPAGGAEHFTWTFSAASAGAVTLNSEIRAYDINSKVTRTAVVSTNVLIQAPAALTAAITAQPSITGVDSIVTVRMTVNNIGQAAASGAAPVGFEAYGDAAYLPVSGPVPVSANIAGGAFTVFTWTYSMTSTGTLNFSSIAAATDFNTGDVIESVYAFSNTVFVRPNTPVLTSYVKVSPQALSINQRFTVTLTVSNEGIVNAPAVTPSAPVFTLPVSVVSGPVPAFTDIPAFGYAVFTWVYQTTATTGNGIADSDATSGIYVSDDLSGGVDNAFTVYGPPSLSANTMQIITPPSVYSSGQNITLVMTINNTGETAAANVAPEMPLVRIGTATAARISGPVPASAAIPALTGSASFTFVYQTGGSGPLALYGRATGSDIRTGANYYSVAASSNSINIETPAALSSIINISGSTLNVGQQVSVFMTVVNSGQAGVENVSPSTLFITSGSTGGMIPPIGPLPLSASIAGNSSAVFTWVFDATAPGTVVLSGNAFGYDENSTLFTYSNMVTSNTVVVQNPASLLSNIWAVPASPEIVKTGQRITVIMSVTNNGGAAAINITPTASALTVGGTGTASIYTGPVPASVASLASGASAYFTWVYTSQPPPGIVTFGNSASAYDLNSGAVIASGASISNPITIADSAYLVNDISVPQLVVSTGQLVTVVLSVTNGGTAGTEVPNNVTAVANVTSFGGGVILVSAPAAVASIPSGASEYFTWTYSATSAGTLVFSAYTRYYDIDGYKESVPAVSPLVEVQTAMNLLSDVFVPVSANSGQLVTVTMIVSNTGGAAANITSLNLTLSNEGGSAWGTLSGSPAVTSIPGGSSQAYQWTYLVSGSGTLYFSGSATAEDTNSLISFTTPYSARKYTAVQQPAGLVISSFNVPAQVAQEQFITITMSVTNEGGGLVTALAPVLYNDDPLLVTYLSGPVPSAVSLAGHTAAVFTWTYSAAATGTVNFSAGANGNDYNTGSLIQTGPSAERPLEITVKQAILAADLIMQPLTVGYNQLFTVRLSVTNTGLYTANNVSADALAWSMPVAGDYLSGTINASSAVVNLTPGQSRVFTWIYRTNNISGTMEFTGRATGTDAVNLWTVNSNAAVNYLVIEPPPTLASSIAAWPIVVNLGQEITIEMTVTNTGTSDADNVVPTQLFRVGTGLADPANPPASAATPLSVSLLAGAEVTFRWIVTASGNGLVAWNGWATGRDINTLQTVYSPGTNSNQVLIQNPAALNFYSFAVPRSVSVGQYFNVTMTVSNTGDATALAVAPIGNPYNVLGTGAVSALPLTYTVDIAGGTDSEFIWTYLATGKGGVQLQGRYDGVDANEGNVISTGIKLSVPAIEVEEVPVLASAVKVTPAARYSNQQFTVTLTVTNTAGTTAPVGYGADAVNVIPSIAFESSGTLPPVVNTVSAPAAVTHTVAGNGGARTFTWVFDAVGDGYVSFTLNAQGQDGNTGAIVASPFASSGLSILPSSYLAVTITAYPETASTGQSVTVVMDVTNAGVPGSAAYNVVPGAVSGFTPRFTYTSGPAGASGVSLVTNAITSYTWIYTAAQAGTVSFNSSVSAFDMGAGTITSYANTSIIRVQTAGALASALVSMPSVVNVGQDFTIITRVTNSLMDANAAAVNNVYPVYVPVMPASIAVPVGAVPNPASYASITAQASADFTWVYNAVGAGVYSFSMRAAGTDNNTLGAVLSNQTALTTVSVQTPANLVSTLTTIPPVTLSRTQVITVVLAVNNTGTSAANSVSPVLSYSDNGSGGSASVIVPPTAGAVSASAPQTIAGSSTGYFTWTYSATAAGEMTFSAYASGTDSVSLAPVVSNTDDSTIIITPPSAVLVSSLEVRAAELPVPLGGALTVILTVTNSGIADASAVTVNMFAPDPVGRVTLNSAPSSLIMASLSVGASQRFTWTYSVNTDPGMVTFTASVQGTNAGTSVYVNTTSVNAVEIRPAGANLGYELVDASPAVIGIGEVITLVVTVSNIGQVNTDSITPVAPLISGTGAVVAVSAPAEMTVALAPNASASFTWTYSSTAGGNVVFEPGFSWTYTDGVVITKNSTALSNTVFIQYGTSLPAQRDDMYLSANSFDPKAGESLNVIFTVTQASAYSKMLVYNVAGEKVYESDFGAVSPGILYTQLAVWNGRASDGMMVTSGMYYIKLKTENFEQVKPVYVIKK